MNSGIYKGEFKSTKGEVQEHIKIKDVQMYQRGSQEHIQGSSGTYKGQFTHCTTGGS